MSENVDPKVTVLETHEELIQQIERGSSKISALAWVTVVVAFVLLVAYVYQFALPFATGTTVATVDLSDPVLQGTEVVVMLLTLAWLYVGISNLRFTRRMVRAIREVRSLEKDIEKRISAQPVDST